MWLPRSTRSPRRTPLAATSVNMGSRRLQSLKRVSEAPGRHVPRPRPRERARSASRLAQRRSGEGRHGPQKDCCRGGPDALSPRIFRRSQVTDPSSLRRTPVAARHASCGIVGRKESSRHQFPCPRRLVRSRPSHAAGAQEERDACGVGFIADLKGRRRHDIIAARSRPRLHGAPRRVRRRRRVGRRRGRAHGGAGAARGGGRAAGQAVGELRRRDDLPAAGGGGRSRRRRSSRRRRRSAGCRCSAGATCRRTRSRCSPRARAADHPPGHHPPPRQDRRRPRGRPVRPPAARPPAPNPTGDASRPPAAPRPPRSPRRAGTRRGVRRRPTSPRRRRAR